MEVFTLLWQWQALVTELLVNGLWTHFAMAMAMARTVLIQEPIQIHLISYNPFSFHCCCHPFRMNSIPTLLLLLPSQCERAFTRVRARSHCYGNGIIFIILVSSCNEFCTQLSRKRQRKNGYHSK